MRDDRVFAATRLLGAVIVPFCWSRSRCQQRPWQLTPLTAQTLGGWFALPGVTALMMGLDGRWTAIRITLESQLIGLALILLGTIRAWEDVDSSNAIAYSFVGGIAGLFVSLLALEWYMVGRTRARLVPTRVAPSR